MIRHAGKRSRRAPGTTLGQRLVVLLLAVMGLFSMLYAGYMSLPPLSESPVAPVWWVVGIVTLVAAYGVWRGAAWGRVLALVVVACSAVRTVWTDLYWMRGTSLSRWIDDGRWLEPVIAVGVASLALWWLARKWPPTQHAASSP
jgi:hypothetical protein